MRTISITIEKLKDPNGTVIHGLPETAEQALADIDEVENSSDADWLPLDCVLSEIRNRHPVYAS